MAIAAPPSRSRRGRLTDQQIVASHARSSRPILGRSPGRRRRAAPSRSLQRYTIPAARRRSSLAYPVDPCLAADDPNYNDQAYWEAAYADGARRRRRYGIAPGSDVWRRLSASQFEHLQRYLACECDRRRRSPACRWRIIVADICRRAGLRTDTSTQIDVSDLTTCVHGLHHRPADVGARCARAAADVWPVGRGRVARRC